MAEAHEQCLLGLDLPGFIILGLSAGLNPQCSCLGHVHVSACSSTAPSPSDAGRLLPTALHAADAVGDLREVWLGSEL